MKWRGTANGYRFTLHDEGSLFVTNDAGDDAFLSLTYEAANAMWEWLESLQRDSYRRGYNDHARTVQHWQDTHGAYRQHGEGENP